MLLQYIACAAVMFGGAIMLTIGVHLDYGTPVRQHAPAKFPSHVELAIGATVILCFAVAGCIMGGK
jgi:hypothetical protein